MNKSALVPHRLWLLALGLALVLLVAVPPLADLARHNSTEEQERLTAKQEELNRQIIQWEKDAATAKELAKALEGDDINTYIAPANRPKLAARLEPLAAQMRLTRLIYAIGPEEDWAGDPAFPDAKGLKQSRLFVEADAALDTDFFDFLESLSSLPGRMDLQRVTIKRAENENAPTETALHAQAELVWLANGPKETEDNK